MPPESSTPLPYRLACLCDIRDKDGRMLLLRRKKSPNKGLYSPIGGKLDVEIGESPTRCAQREILEESGLDIPLDRLHLLGIISESSYEDAGHWLLFVYRVLGAVELEGGEMDEGWLEWHEPSAVDSLPVPRSDAEVLWPLIREQDAACVPGARPGFFAAHIDCGDGRFEWVVEQRH